MSGLKIFFLACAFSNIQIAHLLQCELIAPLAEKESGPEFGVIFVPGAKIEGQAYKPLTEKLQLEFPGKLWVGLTEEWLVDMPNPIQIANAINACFEDAE